VFVLYSVTVLEEDGSCGRRLAMGQSPAEVLDIARWAGLVAFTAQPATEEDMLNAEPL
jgi:hypothetical protein